MGQEVVGEVSHLPCLKVCEHGVNIAGYYEGGSRLFVPVETPCERLPKPFEKLPKPLSGVKTLNAY